ncbi:MAG: NUDIX domain-containing protein [Alphaproteobacteria bacterium]|nr:MAG: NUDIX domain-containing protein [Alphaproteobacteria bacterium]
MPARSAGILFHRIVDGCPEVLLVHPGGPFWKNKDIGAWQVPKGQAREGEDEEAAARREITEELGVRFEGPLTPLGEIRQAGGKTVIAYTAALDVDPSAIVSNTIEIDWPPRSGRKLTIPEIDAARWLGLDEGRRYMLPSQIPLLDRLVAVLTHLPPTGV